MAPCWLLPAIPVLFPARDIRNIAQPAMAHIALVAPGKTSAHVEFTCDGRYARVSVWEMDGALVIYDAASLQEVKRIPMRKPSGKYNVFNKIDRSAGTSH